MLVNQGDQVERGQVLASLDPEPYEISVTSARSQLQSAEANYINKRADLERQKDLLEKGWVAKAAYDQAVAAYDSAEGDLNPERASPGPLPPQQRRTGPEQHPADGAV